MNKDKKLYPKRRFKGFTDDWEQCKLGDIGVITTGNTPPKEVSEYYSDDGIVWVTPTDISENITVETEKRLSKLGQLVGKVVPKNTILVTCIASIGKNTMLGITGSFNQQINGLIPNEDNFEPYFLLTESALWSDQMRKSAAAGTMQIVNRTEFTKLQTLIPKLDEQNIIAKYFLTLDNLITLHQRKLEKLKMMKKAYLAKMFPAENKRKPEIRFKGFTDNWEQRKLGEVADIVGGGTPSTSISEFWDGNIDWYAPAEISDQIYLNSSQRKITEQGYNHSSAKLLPVGTILFTSRAGIGKTAILSQKGCTNQGFQSIVPDKDKLDTYFIFSRTKELKKYGEVVGAGSTFVEVSGKQMANMELMIPKLMVEQQCIGEYFKNLDNIITLHRRKLEKLKNIKKAYLNEMFI